MENKQQCGTLESEGGECILVEEDERGRAHAVGDAGSNQRAAVLGGGVLGDLFAAVTEWAFGGCVLSLKRGVLQEVMFACTHIMACSQNCLSGRGMLKRLIDNEFRATRDLIHELLVSHTPSLKPCPNQVV